MIVTRQSRNPSSSCPWPERTQAVFHAPHEAHGAARQHAGQARGVAQRHAARAANEASSVPHIRRERRSEPWSAPWIEPQRAFTALRTSLGTTNCGDAIPVWEGWRCTVEPHREGHTRSRQLRGDRSHRSSLEPLTRRLEICDQGLEHDQK